MDVEKEARRIVKRFCDGTYGEPERWRFMEWFGDPPSLTPADIVRDIVQLVERAQER